MNSPYSVTIDTRNFVSACRLLQRTSRTLPHQALARAVAFVVKDAKALTPFAPLGKIDRELGVMSSPATVTRGKRKGQPLKSGKLNVDVPRTSLSMRIMLARLHRNTSYNILTDRRYAIDRASFSPGQGQIGFWRKLEARAQAMIAGRHSSTHFFQITWNSLLARLVPLVPPKYRHHFRAAAGRTVDPALSNVMTSGQGSPLAVMTIENRAGMASQYPTIMGIRNLGARRVMYPALDAAVQRGFMSAMAEACKRGLLDQNPELRALGVWCSE